MPPLKPLPSSVLAHDLLSPLDFGLSNDMSPRSPYGPLIDEASYPNIVQETINKVYGNLKAQVGQDETGNPVKWLEAITHWTLGILYLKLARQQAMGIGTVSGRTGQTNIPLGSPDEIRKAAYEHFHEVSILYPDIETPGASSGGSFSVRRVYG